VDKKDIKSKLNPFPKEEATEVVEYFPTECPKCPGTELEQLSTSVEKEELDYEVIVVKRVSKDVFLYNA